MALEIVSLVVALLAVITVVVLSILVVRTRTRGGDDALTTALADHGRLMWCVCRCA